MYISDEQKIKCHAIIHGASASTATVGAGLAQVPLSDTLVIVPIQLAMIISLGAVLDIELSKSSATAILGTVATSTIGRGVSQVLFGWIPGVGNAINASTAAAVTEAAGWAAVKYFENLSDTELSKYDSAKQEGRQEAEAEFSIKYKELNEKFQKAKEVLKEYEKYEYLVLGCFAIGCAAADINGSMSIETMKTLSLVTVGSGYSELPIHIKNKIYNMNYVIPTFNDAMKIIEKVEKKHWTIFNDIVDVILSIDETDRELKSAFRTAWNEKYKAA
jgi:uncharacterized protein (DUF697 family)